MQSVNLVNLTSTSRPTAQQSLLNLYTEPPYEELDLEEFETLAFYRKGLLQRLNDLITQHSISTKITKQLDNNNNNNNNNNTKLQIVQQQKDAEKLQDQVRDFFKKNQDNDQRRDIISHFILALASCDNEQRRKSFIDEEVLLFRWRARMIPDYNLLAEFANQQGLGLEEYELTKLIPYLKPGGLPPSSLQIYYQMVVYLNKYNNPDPNKASFATLKSNPIYSLPFSTVLELFSRDKTKVAVVKGKAYITGSSIVEILSKLYREKLDQKLTRLSQHITTSLSQHLLLPSAVRKIQFGDDEQNGAGSSEAVVTGPITTKDLPILSQQSFPLCMSRLYQHVLREHHTRYGGRGQLNLFFKTIGLPFDQAIEWWRVAFSPKFPGEKFDKEYRYGFSHNYGLEGKRANYSAPGCGRMIAEQVAPQDSHGCPFKHLAGRDPRGMQAMLTQKITPTVSDPALVSGYVDQLMQLCNDGHYQIACTTLWRFTHDNQTPAQNITHPTVYYSQSRQFHSTESENAKANKNNMDDATTTTTTTTTTTPTTL